MPERRKLNSLAKGLSRRAVLNRYNDLLAGRTLTPSKDTLLRLTARLIIHSEDLSQQLDKGDHDDEKLTRILELSHRIEHLLTKVFEDEPTPKLSIIERMTAEREAKEKRE